MIGEIGEPRSPAGAFRELQILRARLLSGSRALLPLLLGVGVGCDGAEGDDTTGLLDSAEGIGDSAGELEDTSGEATPRWDVSPPQEPGSIVTFATECSLGVGVRNMSWVLLDPVAHDWIRNPELTDAPVLADWLPLECFPVLESPSHMTWAENGDIEYSQIHRVSPAYLEGSWLGAVAIYEIPTTDACLAILEEHDALEPALRVARVDPQAP